MNAMKLMYLSLVVAFVSTNGSTSEPCSTAKHLPVVNICTGDTKLKDISNSVLIKADTVENCTCELSITDQTEATQLHIQRFASETSSSPSAYGCGLILDFIIGTDTVWNAQCIVNNDGVISTLLNINHVMKISSLAVDGVLNPNEGYCIEIKKADSDKSGNKLELTCGFGNTITANTTQLEEKQSRIIKTTIPTTTVTNPTSIKTLTKKATTVPLTTIVIPINKTTTTAIDTNDFDIVNSTDTDSSVTTNKANQLKIKDADDRITIAAGTSVGGFVIITVVIIIICIYRRNHSKSTPKPATKPGLTVNNDTDDYGLRENVLYIPADLTPKQTIDNCQNTKRISVDIDGKYSTVNLVTLVEKSTGDYSSIDMVKLAPTESNINWFTNEKPIIAPKTKQKGNIQDDIYAVPDKKRGKHVTAPGEDMCEYAVVSKPNKSNVDKCEDQHSAINVYAVVEKKKRLSDEKNTNQKRDSFTADKDERKD